MITRETYPLRGSAVVITGVSRRAGIGHAVACRLAAYGADLVCHHFAPHDYRQPWGADDLDLHWAVDARSPILLAQAFAARHVAGRRGTIVFMTSGQQRGPMPGEVAYAAAKAGLLGVTATIADELADRGIRVNCVNPGPVDTGYMTEQSKALLVQRFPFGRIGLPDDAAKVVAWLCTDEAAWITGHVLDSEGGFRR